jgi:hypothetical protein
MFLLVDRWRWRYIYAELPFIISLIHLNIPPFLMHPTPLPYADMRVLVLLNFWPTRTKTFTSLK